MRENPRRAEDSGPENVETLVTEDGPLSPAQLCHWLRKQALAGRFEKLVVVMRGLDGAWRTTWSDVEPDELLAAGVALKLDSETAWAEIQEQLQEDPDEGDGKD